MRNITPSAPPGGLLIAEASPVMATAFGSPGVPGIYTEQQVAGWRKVVDAVHAKGGVIFLQLWHVGRVSHSSFQPGDVLPVAPSAVAIPPDLKTGTADGKVTVQATQPRWRHRRFRRGRRVPAGCEERASRRLRRLSRSMAPTAIWIEQFLQSHQSAPINMAAHREPRRFLMEVTRGRGRVWGAKLRVGVRLSPYGIANGSGEPDPMPLYAYVVQSLNPFGLAYLHLIEPRSQRRRPRRSQPSERAVGDGAV
jgi:N-ethylmaleimide reductase